MSQRERSFDSSSPWDNDEVLRRCRKVVASEQSDPEAIGVIDENGTAKAGKEAVGVKRQYEGNRGKVENAVVSVGLRKRGRDEPYEAE